MTARHRWTPAQEQRLRELYTDTPADRIAAELGLPVAKVHGKAWRMGLRKSRAAIAQIARDRTGPDHASVAYRWQPGTKPWNTGVKGSTGHHPHCRAHQFRPGNRPHTWVPVGSFRVAHGLLEIKYSNDPGGPHKRWRPYHTHMWVQAHGPVPKGHLVVFRPGRKTLDAELITLDAVELITCAENMARNTMHRLPKELAQVHQLRGVLTRTINQRQKGGA